MVIAWDTVFEQYVWSRVSLVFERQAIENKIWWCGTVKLGIKKYVHVIQIIIHKIKMMICEWSSSDVDKRWYRNLCPILTPWKILFLYSKKGILII